MKTNLLTGINSVSDLRKIPETDLPQLANELREFIIEVVSEHGGHLGASLGVIELTIALHYFFNTPEDKLIWDVGHQAYAHKILTGRRDHFKTNRKLHGLSGFPKISESTFDTFGAGHSSTSISAALGMAVASGLQNKPIESIAIIGDAAIAGGMAFEALNHAGMVNANLLVILNDNNMGIDPSVGALKKHLNTLKTESATGNNLFKALNFHYEGPVDGHNITQLFKAFQKLKKINGPKLLHVQTIKGKGLAEAEKDQIRYHAPGKFNKLTGKISAESAADVLPKYQDVFGLTLVELAEQNQQIIGVTPAMPTGSSLNYMLRKFPEQTFDVGIAEQHAVTFSAGMALEGKIVFCVIYSTFLQRAYDQLIHDVALQNIPVIFCIDRAGLVGADGPTHHGVFDIAFLRCIPNLSIAAPSDEVDLRQLLYTASLGLGGPLAIRYPRGKGRIKNWKKDFQKIAFGKGRILKKGEAIAVLSVGTIKSNCESAIQSLTNPEKIAHYDLRFIKPLDQDLLKQIFKQFNRIITVEDGVSSGGFGDAVLDFANSCGYQGKIRKLGIPDTFIEQGTIPELQEIAGISVDKIAEVLKEEL